LRIIWKEPIEATSKVQFGNLTVGSRDATCKRMMIASIRCDNWSWYLRNRK